MYKDDPTPYLVGGFLVIFFAFMTALALLEHSEAMSKHKVIAECSKTPNAALCILALR